MQRLPRSEFGVYGIVDSGRICVAALNERNIGPSSPPCSGDVTRLNPARFGRDCRENATLQHSGRTAPAAAPRDRDHVLPDLRNAACACAMILEFASAAVYRLFNHPRCRRSHKADGAARVNRPRPDAPPGQGEKPLRHPTATVDVQVAVRERGGRSQAVLPAAALQAASPTTRGRWNR